MEGTEDGRCRRGQRRRLARGPPTWRAGVAAAGGHVRRALLRPGVRVRRHAAHRADRPRPDSGGSPPVGPRGLAHLVGVDPVHLDPQPGRHDPRPGAGHHPGCNGHRLRDGGIRAASVHRRGALVRAPLCGRWTPRARPPGARGDGARGRRPRGRLSLGRYVARGSRAGARGSVRRSWPAQHHLAGCDRRRLRGGNARRSSDDLGPERGPHHRATRAVRHHRPRRIADRGRGGRSQVRR